VVRRTPKDVSSFALSTGPKGTFSLMRSVGHLRDAAAKIRGAAVLVEHSRVMAVREIHEGDETVPAGATGTVVHVIKGGGGYDVEFTAPKHVVISAGRDELAPA
jgi:hypothetical protein